MVMFVLFKLILHSNTGKAHNLSREPFPSSRLPLFPTSNKLPQSLPVWLTMSLGCFFVFFDLPFDFFVCKHIKHHTSIYSVP